MMRSRSGSAAVEFALILPVLLVLTLGIMDWSWYLIEYQKVLSAAQAGVRTGAQTSIDDDPAADAETAAKTVLDASHPGGIPSGTTYTAQIVDGNTVELAVSVPFEALVGYLLMPEGVSATARMRVEDAG